MLDFTSALYLGFRHAAESLRPWDQLSTGRPAALWEPRKIRKIARGLALFQGCGSSIFAPSTLHLVWDVFGLWPVSRTSIYVDVGTYPILRWGLERAAARGIPVRSFPHNDVDALGVLIDNDAPHRQPLVVADGLCPACGKAAPLAAYLDLVEPLGGYVILDDTQGFGILGHYPDPNAPYGRGGGGILRWSTIMSPRVLLICSLAKGFGVPLAVLSGNTRMIQRFKRQSETRMHCSPPAIAMLSAAEHALSLNARRGDALRFHLAKLVSHFKRRLAQHGISTNEGLFPVQTLTSTAGLNAKLLHQILEKNGIRTILQRGRHGHRAQVTFLISARHHLRDIDEAADRLTDLMNGYTDTHKQWG